MLDELDDSYVAVSLDFPQQLQAATYLLWANFEPTIKTMLKFFTGVDGQGLTSTLGSDHRQLPRP